MVLDAWLPKNHPIPNDVMVIGAVYVGVNWQIYEIQSGGRALLVIEELAERWMKSGLVEVGSGEYFQFGSEKYFVMVSGPKFELAPLSDSPAPTGKEKALVFAKVLATTRAIESETSLSESIYFEKLMRLLPTYNDHVPMSDDIVLGRWMTGGVPISVNANERLKKLVNWLDTETLDEIKNCAAIKKISPKTEGAIKEQGSKTAFTLPGRPYLERFINEHVVDIIQNRERYSAFGIDFPSAIILHGPPGCGKTFAIERLVEYLEWPCFHVEASSVASPYIHETSKKIAAVFDRAMENSPSVIVIDEMEAFLADRQASIGHHHVEEVAEFLRRIPEAIKNSVLIVAMTNRIKMIDPAILRRGRFDHVIKVDMANEEEVTALLEKLLNEIPQEQGINISVLAKQLVGRPLSDVAFIVREGSRLAARAGKNKIDQLCLVKALEASPTRNTANL